MLAPAPAVAAGAAAAGAVAGRAFPGPGAPVARTGPAIQPPRRRIQPEARGGTPPLVWVLLVLAILGAAGAIWYAASSRQATGPGRPLSDLPDSAQKDTTGADTLSATDAPRIDRDGFELLRQGNFGQAADAFRQAMELDPTRAEYKDHLAFALINQQRYTEAAALLEEATRQDPNYDLSYSHLGNARLALGDTLGAVVALRRFLDVSVNQHDRAEVQQKLNELLAPHPAPPPPDTAPAGDTIHMLPPGGTPTDSIRIGPPR
jgi:hypothetical protein